MSVRKPLGAAVKEMLEQPVRLTGWPPPLRFWALAVTWAGCCQASALAEKLSGPRQLVGRVR